MKRSVSAIRRFINEHGREPNESEVKELFNIRSQSLARAIVREFTEARVLRSPVAAGSGEDE